MNLTRIRRLLKLIGQLQTGQAHNTKTLSQLCSVSRRTIFRDLEALRDVGVPLHFDEINQRYHIPGTYFLPPTNFNIEEALAVIVLCHELGNKSRLPFYSAATSAAMKLEGALPSRLRDQLAEITSAIQIRLEPANPLEGKQTVYDQLRTAIRDSRAVRIVYGSLTEGEEITTRLSPYRLLFSRRAWYIIGRSSIHRQTRTFHVGRIIQLEQLDDHFKKPRGFSIERYFRNAWHLIPEPGPDQDVAIRFSPKVAQNVAEVAWHSTQRVEFRDDGTMDYHVTVSGLNEISWWILGYGDQAEVLAPNKLRHLIASRAARMVECYRDTGDEA